MPTWKTEDSAQVVALLASEEFRAGVREVARQQGIDEATALADAAAALREMSATHQDRAGLVWDRFGDWMSRGYDVLVDDDGLAHLRRLDREHSLVFLISHRSYLDEFVLPPSLKRGDLSPLFGIAGGNLDFFPFGDIARRNGIVHVRRDTTGMPMYRLALRAFIAQLVKDKANMCWSIEGGRTRTGKLRPPRYGLLRYVADAVESADAAPLLVPVSIMYDQIPSDEISRMAAEARGAAKQAENVRWLVRYAAGLNERRGRIYVDFGTPVDLRARMNELNEAAVTENVVERVALDVCHRLNAATPITPTAAICVALLGEDRALTLDEVLATVRPLAEYVHGRGWPVAGAANLTDRSTLRWALRELCRSGVLTEYRAGTETVWNIGPDKHLIAAFYRNSVLHVLLVRAVAELALRRIIDEPDGNGKTLRSAALRLREGLKFDFFFAPREAFLDELRLEIEILAGEPGADLDDVTPEQAELWLQKADLLVAPLVLRPFIDSYRVLAHQLAEAGDEEVTDTEPVLRQALATGQLWALRRMIASEESVSGEMFRTALKLAAHRGLLTGADLGSRRRQFADEADQVAAAIGRLAGMGR